ncbi:iron chaperone [Amphibacillus sp. Q70]|uniref:iron chaperone n=1 Tax=Amphibacillus sp. Q70 TaxID=3453416 RepID=UPI003F833F50
MAEQSEHVQPFLNQVRETIRSVLPDAQEKISWRMPTYWKNHNIIHFAAFKNHISLYPGKRAVKYFADELIDYKTNKGTIQFLYSKPIPLNLIAEITRWCYETGNQG